MIYSFGPFQLDVRSRRLVKAGTIVGLPDRQLDVLLHLVAHAGQVVSKDALITAAWNDVAVTDNSLEQAISSLRRTLGDPPAGDAAYIETHARRGYRFAATTTSSLSRVGDEALSAMLAPYRALIEGRAALETLDREQVVHACRVFEEITRTAPDYAAAHLGLANSLALAMESVRADTVRDESMLARALHHAAEACRLDPTAGEAWAALSLLSHQSRDHAAAVAAAQRSAALEPDNWRHHLRLAYVSWGETRLRAAHRVLKLLPHFPFAHWLAATVHIAREAFDQAAQELEAGADAQDRQPGDAPFKGVGLHLLLGLLKLAVGDEARATEELHRELTFEGSRHIYGREASANAWCALAAISIRRKQRDEARAALQHALDIIPGHATALAARAALTSTRSDVGTRPTFDARIAQLEQAGALMDAAIAKSVYLALTDDSKAAAKTLEGALRDSGTVGAAWIVPVEPMLGVATARDHWRDVLAVLRSRAM
jgi:DNA-binding winged helix-turn-helix (wHTH) protein